MQFPGQPSQKELYGWVATGRRAEISQESLTLRRNLISACSITHVSICPIPVLPGTVGMALPTKPLAAAECRSRQCSQPGAEAGASTDRHPKEWLMAHNFEEPMAMSPPPEERSSGRGLRRVRLRDCCSCLDPGGHFQGPAFGHSWDEEVGLW